MFCQSCGNEIKEEQTFCRMCGEQASFGEISLFKMSLSKRASIFSLGAGGILIFLFLFIFLKSLLGLSDGVLFGFLLFTSLLSSGTAALLFMKIKEINGTFKKAESRRKIGNLREESKQIGEKSFVPISWSVTDKTTKNLLPNKKRITGEL
ncbi:MAG: zinc ribbon domain-containing protein [Acidobacteria bacterium]|nr:zinc ribbon domain-containing protein [Acidobacteriota bacterium]